MESQYLEAIAFAIQSICIVKLARQLINNRKKPSTYYFHMNAKY